MPTILISVHAVNRYLKRIDRDATHIEARRILVAAARNATMTPRKTFDGASIWETPVAPIRLITKARWCEPGFVKCVTVLTLDEEYEPEEETIAEVLDAAARATGTSRADAAPATTATTPQAAPIPAAAPPLPVVVKKKVDSPEVFHLKTQLEVVRAKLKREIDSRLELEVAHRRKVDAMGAYNRTMDESRNKRVESMATRLRLAEVSRDKAWSHCTAHNLRMSLATAQMRTALIAAVRGLLGFDDVETALSSIQAVDSFYVTKAFADPTSIEREERDRLLTEYLARHRRESEPPQEQAAE